MQSDLELIGGPVVLLWWIAMPCGPVVGWLIHRLWPRLEVVMQRSLLAAFISLTGSGLLATLTSWSFRSDVLAAILLVLAYFSAIALFAIPQVDARPRHSFLRRASSTILLLLVLYGLWVAFWRHTTWDVYEPLTTEVPLGNNLYVRRVSAGFIAQNYEGVRVIERPPHVRFLEKSLYSINIGETDECNRSTIRVYLDRTSHVVVVQCGDSHPYVWAHVKIP